MEEEEVNKNPRNSISDLSPDRNEQSINTINDSATIMKNNEYHVTLDQIDTNSYLSVEVKKNTIQEQVGDQEQDGYIENDMEPCYKKLYDELQTKYDGLLTQYQDTLERANTLQSSLYYQEYRWQSLSCQLQMVIDDLSQEPSPSTPSVNHSIQSLQHLKESISSLFLVDPYSSEPSTISEMEEPEAELDASIDEISQSLEILEKHVSENDEVINSLKDLPQPIFEMINSLKMKLNVLASINCTLNDVVDQHHIETIELSTLLNEKRREICMLRNSEVEYKSQTSAYIQELNSQIVSLQNSLFQEVYKTNHLQKELVIAEDNYKKQLEVNEKELEKEISRRKEMLEKDREKEQLKKEFDCLSSSFTLLQQENEKLKENQVSVENLQQQLQNAESMIRILQERLQQQVQEQLLHTSAGELSLSNPAAIIACVEALVSQISIETARATILEQKLKAREDAEKIVISKGNELQLKFIKLAKLYRSKQKMIVSLKNQLEKYKKNEKIYRQVIEMMKEAVRLKENQLASVYVTINGISSKCFI